MPRYCREICSFVLFMKLVATCTGSSFSVNTIMGSGATTSSGTGGPAISAGLSNPRSVVSDSTGVVYVAEQGGHCIRKFGSSNIVQEFAGICGSPGSTGDSGPASSALLNGAIDFFIDSLGITYIADYSNCKIRSVSTGSIITTFAGTGNSGTSGDGGKATSATFTHPYGIWGDSTGVIYITQDIGSVRQISTSQIITLFAGINSNTYGGDGGPATSASLNQPTRVFGNTVGSVYIGDSANNLIRKVSSGIITQYAGTGGTTYTGENVAPTSTGINLATDITIDASSGDLFFSNFFGCRVHTIRSSSGLVTTFVGTGVCTSSGANGDAATSSSFNNPDGLFLMTSGTLLVVDENGSVVRKVYSTSPTVSPSVVPSVSPSIKPSVAPSVVPTVAPSVQPSVAPSVQPTIAPSVLPSVAPSVQPSTAPSVAPSVPPSVLPTVPPTITPTVIPTVAPSAVPSVQPSVSTAPSLTSLPITRSPNYKVTNALAFAGLTSEGGVLTWGSSGSGGDSSGVSALLSSDVSVVVSSKNAFAAVKADGSVVAWGRSAEISGWSAYSSASAGVVSLVATEQAFAGVTSAGGVIAFGADCCGGNVDQYGESASLTSGVVSIAASAGAFCALKVDGTVFCWGSGFTGGGVSSATRSDVVNVVLLVSSRSAFAALTSAGAVVTWGCSASGGVIPATVATQLHGIQHILSSDSGFAAYSSTSGLHSWGFAGDVMGLTNVTFVAHTGGAFAALKSDAGVVAWGDSELGGDVSSLTSQLVGVSSVVETEGAFAALTGGGAVVAWGSATLGGQLFANVSSSMSEIDSLYSTKRAFAALSASGGVTVWGATHFGGVLSSDVSSQLLSDVSMICSNDVAFTAIKSDGSAYGWGLSASLTAGRLNGEFSAVVSC